MTACTEPECARLRDEIRAALRQAEGQLEQHKRLQTLGGPPPPYTHDWTPGSLPGGPEAEYAALGDRSAGSARTSGTTERKTP